MSRRAKGGFFNNRAQGPGRGGGRGRHPSHLKGRDIGLWYAQKGRQKDEDDTKVALEPDISLSQTKTLEIRFLLDECKFLDDKSQHGASSQCHRFRQDFLRVTTEDIERQMQISIATRKDLDVGASNRQAEFDEELQEEFAMQMTEDTGNELLKFRQKLPCWKKRMEIVDLIRANRVVLIKGETGCGKTTQVTQFILDDAIASGEGSKCRVLCTQPRRISGELAPK